MNKHRTIHPSLSPSPVPNTAVSTDCSQQHIYKTCHCHSLIDDNQHRNNHNSDLIQYDEISKTINDITPRKRRHEYHHHRSDEKTSLLPIYINNTLLILIRLMILFIVVLIISCTFYYAIVYIYPKRKKTGWEQMIHWFYQE